MGTTITPTMKAPSMGFRALQTGMGARIEAFLDVERDQIALWLPVALGAGIAAWFVLPGVQAWVGWMVAMAGIACAALLLPLGGRLRRVTFFAALVALLGCGVIWARAAWVAGPVLTRPVMASFTAEVQRVEMQTARDRVRLTLRPVDAPELPLRVRVNVDDDGVTPLSFAAGDRVTLRARLVGPQNASVPGGFDFSRVAWFQGLGATGKAIGPVTRVGAAQAAEPGFRDRLSTHIRG